MASGEEERATERKPVVLIVDDEPQIIEFLRMGFGYEGFCVGIARTGPEALQAVAAQQPDMVIFDVMLPGLNGLEVAQQIRKAHDTCIIMLTAKEDVEDLVAGLDMGADDYVTKPFVFRELMARVRAVLRRRGLHLGELLTFQGLTLNRNTRIVTRDDIVWPACGAADGARSIDLGDRRKCLARKPGGCAQ